MRIDDNTAMVMEGIPADELPDTEPAEPLRGEARLLRSLRFPAPFVLLMRELQKKEARTFTNTVLWCIRAYTREHYPELAKIIDEPAVY